VLNDPVRRARYDRVTQPARRHPTSPVTRSALTYRGVLELSPREAHLAATTPLTLTTADGISFALPAGVADDDQVVVELGTVRAVLTVRLPRERT
jgi:sugar (pentulose or hexulose) kinase